MSITWISHRGYKEHAVENTREAFQAALACGFTALETDLRLSKDGHIVLLHDVNMQRLAGSQVRVADLTRQELSRIVLTDRGYSGSVLFLDEFVREFPGCGWTFDIKPENGEDTIQALHSWAKKQGLLDWISAQSKCVVWNNSQDRYLRSFFPHVPCYARESECWLAGMSVLFGLPGVGLIQPNKVYSLPPKLGPLSLYKKKIVSSFHGLGAGVLAFLPDSTSDVQAAIESGVDEILTNGTPWNRA